MRETRVLLEVCVDTADGARIAAESGVGRIELCAALSEDGLTPSVAMMRAAAGLSAPAFAMIRPRGGDFRFSPAEVDVMLADIEAARETGVAGVVLGATRRDNALDLDVLKDLLAAAAPLPATLHRAFDVVPDQFAALESAVDLGFERILTSGGKLSAGEGAATVSALVERAAGRISIMPGGGITPDTVADLVKRTGVHEVHASCAARLPPPTGKDVEFGFEPAAGRMATSGSLISAMLAEL